MSDLNKDNYCVIMAGGIGSRFWPMSRTSFPKQFHDILGTGKTLIQMTFDRFASICPKENILVVTNEIYKDLVLEQIPEMGESQVLCEPAMRNTAPCVAYANFHIASKNPNARIIVAPADHLITNETEFNRIIDLAFVESEKGSLVTLGIKPHRPDTGYGYINFDENTTGEVRDVIRFEEKPNIEKAIQFLENGNYFWNSGIFIWTLKSIQEEFKAHLSNMFALFLKNETRFGTSDESSAITEIYDDCENISIDYGIMEKSETVKVILSDFGWSDLGTWGSLSDHISKDDNNNATVGEVKMSNSNENIVFSSNKNKLIAIEGLQDFIVVDTKDALLICPKKSEQKIKEIVTELKSDPKSPYC